MKLPDDLKYTREHEWIRDNLDGTATVGVTDFAQQELGDIVFVELEPVGSEIVQDSTFGTIEAVKTVSDLFSPVSGRIAAVNEELENDPERVNRDPYGDGWLIRVELKDSGQLSTLMSAEEYKTIIDQP